MAQGHFAVGEAAGPCHDAQHPLGVGDMGEEHIHHPPPPVLRHGQTVLDQKTKASQLIVVWPLKPDRQSRHGGAGQGHQIEATGEFIWGRRRLTLFGLNKIGPHISGPVAKDGGGAGAQSVGGQRPFTVCRNGAVEKAEERLFALSRLSPDPSQDRFGKSQGRRLVAPGLKERKQGPKGGVSAGAITTLLGDHQAEFVRLVAAKRLNSDVQLTQSLVRAGLDHRFKSRAMGGGQGGQGDAPPAAFRSILRLGKRGRPPASWERWMPVIAIEGLTKTYKSGHQAPKSIDLAIEKGEIFALLGPNGAGKTTLISIICGIVTPSSGTITADGHDTRKDFRAARTKIGLVPQELTTDAFETVLATVTFSRGLFGKAPAPELVEQILKDLSLWDKRNAKIMTLSGGMKRRVMIAKALSHQPDILFLDEPTAGVDVELRRDMWAMVRKLRER
ncbi:hypothetical protein LTR94_024894, partial [Friedmanniomyces endolithicus]